MSKIIDVNGFSIGGRQTFVIAEIGSNYNQSWDLALESIDAAIESGANAVKFQSLNVDKLYKDPAQDIIDIHKKIDLEESWHQTLNDYCKKKGTIFFSSPTYMESVDILESIDVPLYKLASAQIGTFPQLIDRVASKGKPTILSTGIINMSDLEGVIDIFKRNNNEQYIILHCNSMYPTPYDDVNLGRMEMYREKFETVIGYSDHSDGIYTAIAAVAQGAKVIEKHFAIDRNLPVPDAAFSLEPADFKAMVDGIRIAERSSGDAPRDKIEAREQAFKDRILYRLYLNKDKKAGDVVRTDDVDYFRNPNGIDCREADKIQGKTLIQDQAAGTRLEFEMFNA